MSHVRRVRVSEKCFVDGTRRRPGEVFDWRNAPKKLPDYATPVGDDVPLGFSPDPATVGKAELPEMAPRLGAGSHQTSIPWADPKPGAQSAAKADSEPAADVLS